MHTYMYADMHNVTRKYIKKVEQKKKKKTQEREEIATTTLCYDIYYILYLKVYIIIIYTEGMSLRTFGI